MLAFFLLIDYFLHFSFLIIHFSLFFLWSRISDSNRSPTAYKAVALPNELIRHILFTGIYSTSHNLVRRIADIFYDSYLSTIKYLLCNLFSKSFCNSRLFSSCSIFFNNTYFVAFINKFVYFVKVFLCNLFLFAYAFQKLFDSHLHSNFKFIIPFLEYKRSFRCFLCWFCNWHPNRV